MRARSRQSRPMRVLHSEMILPALQSVVGPALVPRNHVVLVSLVADILPFQLAVGSLRQGQDSNCYGDDGFHLCCSPGCLCVNAEHSTDAAFKVPSV